MDTFTIIWIMVIVIIVLITVVLLVVLIISGSTLVTADIDPREMRVLDRLREQRTSYGPPVRAPRGRTVLRLWMQGLVITENGIMARFGAPREHSFAPSSKLRDVHIAILAKKEFYRFEDISGIYPIELRADTQHLDGDVSPFPGVQIETVDYKTAIVPYYFSQTAGDQVLEAIGRWRMMLYQSDEVLRGTMTYETTSGNAGIQVYHGDLHRHRYLREEYEPPDG